MALIRDSERTLSLREWTAFLSAWNLLNVGKSSKPAQKDLDEEHSVLSTEEDGHEEKEEEGSKEGNKEGNKERRKEGGKEGRKEGLNTSTGLEKKRRTL